MGPAMQQPRLAHTIVAAAIFITAAGLSAPASPWINTGVPNDAFWIDKAFHDKTYDIVVAGDSRVLKGISPRAMEKVLEGVKIFNFGFDHNAFTQSYLRTTESLVDRKSRQKAILLGISPQSLTREAAQRNGFLALRGNGRFKRFKMRYLQPYLSFFEPYNLYQIFEIVRGIPPVLYYQHHTPGGWVASHKEPEDPFYQIRRYQGRFDNNQVSSTLTRQLFEYVRRWRQAGIEVLAMRLPTSPAMLALENNESGFDQERFVREFEKAGGSWIELEQNGYHSYDGSHLHKDAAIKLSVQIARKLESRMVTDRRQAKSGRN